MKVSVRAASLCCALTVATLGTARAQAPLGPPPAPAAPPSSQAAPATQADAKQPGGKPEAADYNLRLREIEERVNQLKEKIFQSKARLIQLQEVVLTGTISGARAVVVHKNEMGSSFRLTRIQYALDGASIFTRDDTGQGELEAESELEVFNGAIAPGSHQLSIYLEYQGHGYGIFSYLKGYKFKVKSSYTFSAEEGKQTRVTVVGFEKGGITTQLSERPAVRYDVETSKELLAPTTDSAPGPKGDAAR